MSLLIIMILFINLRHFHVVIEGDRMLHNLTSSCSSLGVIKVLINVCLEHLSGTKINFNFGFTSHIPAYEMNGLTTHMHSQWLLFSLFNPLTSVSET